MLRAAEACRGFRSEGSCYDIVFFVWAEMSSSARLYPRTGSCACRRTRLSSAAGASGSTCGRRRGYARFMVAQNGSMALMRACRRTYSPGPVARSPCAAGSAIRNAGTRACLPTDPTGTSAAPVVSSSAGFALVSHGDGVERPAPAPVRERNGLPFGRCGTQTGFARLHGMNRHHALSPDRQRLRRASIRLWTSEASLPRRVVLIAPRGLLMITGQLSAGSPP